LSECIIESREYNSEWTDVTWETCTLRKYLNGEFLNKFGQEEQGLIIEKTIGNPNNLWYIIKGGRDTTDKIFLLSLEEADEYFGNSGDYKNKRKINSYWFSNKYDADRAAKYDEKSDSTDWWWLRSPGYSSFGAAYVGNGGVVDVDGYGVFYLSGGVRPALRVNLKSYEG